MLKVTATNFGVNPSDIQIDAYNGGNFIILNGEISVDTSFEGYKSLFTLELTTEDLPFTRSLPTAVYATVEADKVNYITITKAYVKDRNTISIRPVRAYDSYGSYKLKFFCAFAAINTAAEPTFQHCDKLLLEPTVGTMTDAECYLMKNDNWMLLVLKTGAITFDETEGIIKANITTVLPDGQVFFVPIISSDNKSSDNGNLYFQGTIEDGTLTISRNGETDTSTGSSETFTKVFILLNT